MEGAATRPFRYVSHVFTRVMSCKLCNSATLDRLRFSRLGNLYSVPTIERKILNLRTCMRRIVEKEVDQNGDGDSTKKNAFKGMEIL